MLRTHRCSLAVLCALLVFPAAASASSTVSLGGRALTVTGSAGVDNVSVNYRDYSAPNGLVITDSNGITAGAGCTMESATSVVCATAKPAAGNLVTATVNLGDGDDGYSNYVDGIADTIDGGTGNDKVNGRVAGDSTVPATDIVNGGDGNDEISAGSGAGTTCNGGNGDDYITCFYVPTGVVVNGGAGRDTITGGDGPDQLNGDAGNDVRISGGKGNDVIHGGDGDDGNQGVSDMLNGGEGADEIFGDAGIDRLVEDRNSDHKQFWSLDDQANDGQDSDDNGAADEGDNVHSDVENVTGGYDDDTIVGSGAANVLNGGTLGDDTILGLGGDDQLFTGITGDKDSADGGEGNDKVQGNGTLVGGPGNDQMAGQSGNDLIDAGPGIDTVSAGDGNDVVRAADGEVDTVGCGIGADVAEVDGSDVINQDPGDLCETKTVKQAAAPGTTQNPTGNPNASATLLVLGATAKLKGSTAAFGLTTPGAGIVSAQVLVGGAGARAAAAKAIVVGKALKNITKAGKLTLKIKLKGKTKAVKRLLKRKKFVVTLKTRFTPAGGAAGKWQTRKVTVKR